MNTRAGRLHAQRLKKETLLTRHYVSVYMLKYHTGLPGVLLSISLCYVKKLPVFKET